MKSDSDNAAEFGNVDKATNNAKSVAGCRVASACLCRGMGPRAHKTNESRQPRVAVVVVLLCMFTLCVFFVGFCFYFLRVHLSITFLELVFCIHFAFHNGNWVSVGVSAEDRQSVTEKKTQSHNRTQKLHPCLRMVVFHLQHFAGVADRHLSLCTLCASSREERTCTPVLWTTHCNIHHNEDTHDSHSLGPSVVSVSGSKDSKDG